MNLLISTYPSRFKEQLTSGDLDLTVANKIAQMEPERQEQLWEESRETPDLSVSDVQGFAETGTLKKKKPRVIQGETYDTFPQLFGIRHGIPGGPPGG